MFKARFNDVVGAGFVCSVMYMWCGHTLYLKFATLYFFYLNRPVYYTNFAKITCQILNVGHALPLFVIPYALNCYLSYKI